MSRKGKSCVSCVCATVFFVHTPRRMYILLYSVFCWKNLEGKNCTTLTQRTYIRTKRKKQQVHIYKNKNKESLGILGSDQAGRFFFEVKYQHSGEVMNIPPGWAHTVINLQVGHVKVNLIYTTFDCILYS